MHSGWWGFQETNAWLDLRHVNYSCEIFFCFIPLPIPQCIARNSNAILSVCLKSDTTTKLKKCFHIIFACYCVKVRVQWRHCEKNHISDRKMRIKLSVLGVARKNIWSNLLFDSYRFTPRSIILITLQKEFGKVFVPLPDWKFRKRSTLALNRISMELARNFQSV